MLQSDGVPIIRKRISSLDEAYTFGPVDLVINCTGLGARTLLGVQDTKVYPARGQTVLVRAPKVTWCSSTKSKDRLQSTGVQTYIIPRPGGQGHVILGGTFEKDIWDVQPDPKQAERILKECYELCPELSEKGGWEGIEVLSHNVGLRPAREGGARVELEKRTVGVGALVPSEGRIEGGREVGVVHAYGIGPAG